MNFKNLERYRTGGTTGNMQLAIPLPKTPGNRIYRLSPNEKAHPRHFVMGDFVTEVTSTPEIRDRQKIEPRSKQMVCPYSGVVRPQEDFTHPDDAKAAIAVAEHAVMKDINEMFANMFKGMEQKPKGGFFSVSVKTKSSPPHPKPRFMRKDLMREMVCDHCGRDYGVFALGLFCPECGAPNLSQHFARERELVSKQVAVANEQAMSDEELAYRFLGNAHEDVLTGFEATLKAVFRFAKSQGTEEQPKVGNDFQNMEKAERRFAELGLKLFDVLTTEEREVLALNIQKRHIIGHNLGIVDEKFVKEDSEAKLGQTIKIIGDDILEFGNTAQKIINFLDEWLVKADISAPVTIAKPLPKSPLDPDVANAEKLNLSLLAYRLAKFLAQSTKTGLTEHVSTDNLLTEFSDIDKKVLNKAINELDHDGYLETNRHMGAQIPRMRYLTLFFETFDPLVMGTDPNQDEIELAKLLAARDEDSVNAQDFHKDSGMDLRRFNPAFTLILGRLRGPRMEAGAMDYPVRHFAISGIDRVALERFVKQMTQ